MRIAIFIEPSGGLKTNILHWKNKVNDEFSMQPYCSHPPHSTLIQTEVTDVGMAIAETGNSLRSSPSFELRSDEASVFWKDAATGGGHTLVWKLTQSSQLKELQLKVAKSIAPFSCERLTPSYVKDSPLLFDSFERYGFPFVGDHWIPHMTIASLQVKSDHKIIEAFLDQSKTFQMKVEEISCWRIEEDQHTLMERFTLQ